MLRKKTKGVAIGSQTSSFIGRATEKVVDRRDFLKGSGLAVGGIATAAALVGAGFVGLISVFNIFGRI